MSQNSSTPFSTSEPSPCDRFMAQRRRGRVRALVLALVIVAFAVSVGVWRHQTGALEGAQSAQPVAAAIRA